MDATVEFLFLIHYFLLARYKMREQRSFGERSVLSQSKEPKSKYFLFFEGEKTEHIYFDSVKNLKKQIGISPLIDIIPMFRSYSEKGFSNPKKIVDKVVDIVEQNEGKYMTYGTFRNNVMDYFKEVDLFCQYNIQEHDVFTVLLNICRNYSNRNEDENEKIEDIEKLYNDIFIEFTFINIQEFYQYMQIPSITYSKDYDTICLIIDRDKQSFKSTQYDKVLDICKQHNFELCVTNPCFEFWLLLHFDQVFSINEEELLKNCKVTNKKTYVMKELSKIIPYQKDRFDADSLVMNIDKAIKNETFFCEDIEELKNKLGSNIGNLITKMRY